MEYTIKGFIVEERSLKDFVEDIEVYSELVKKIIWDNICLCFDGIDSDLMEIKSPIEQAFYLVMNPYIGYLRERSFVEAVAFDPQYSIKAGGKTYRADFSLGVLLRDNTTLNYVIECDGHDFHEKTKKQAAHDKQRERALIAEGYTVIRFTGSEIYSDPHKCAEEVYSLALNEIRRRKNG